MTSRVTVTFPDYSVRVQLEIVQGSRPSYRGKIIADGKEPVPFSHLRLSAFRGFVGHFPNDWRDAAVEAIAFMSYGPTGSEETDEERKLAHMYASRLDYARMVVNDADDRKGPRVRYRVRARK